MEKSKLAQEIRINNLLQYKEGKDVAIVEFVSNKHFDCRTQSGFFTPNGEYEPIELTEYWLLKLGFEKINYTFWAKGLAVHNHDIVNFYMLYDQNRTYIKYVHQLQNLYHSLCGEELKIKEI